MYHQQKHYIRRASAIVVLYGGLCEVRACNWEYMDLVRVHGSYCRDCRYSALSHRYKVGKTRVTGCLEHGYQL